MLRVIRKLSRNTTLRSTIIVNQYAYNTARGKLVHKH